VDRRRFLAASGAALLAAGCSAPLVADASSRRRWGVQLFTVLEPLELDFEGTLREVARIGYKEVETIGSFGRDPAYVRGLFDKYGLTSPSQHLAPKPVYASFAGWSKREISTEQNRATFADAFRLDRAEALIEDGIRTAKALGQRYVVWQILLPPQLATRKIIDDHIRMFNHAGDLCAREGLVFTYHNHDREFGRVGNDVPYDLIVANTNPATVKLELDFYWAMKAKADPLAYLRNNPGRFKLAHVKDMAKDGDFAVVGGGTLDVPGLIAAGRQAGIEHFYVEYDRSSDPMREIRESFAYLQNLPA
jgi:sugar phosphate isomerase/epimerase